MMTNRHTETIRCPRCGEVQFADVEHTVPFHSYAHECSCGYWITESEWEREFAANLYRVTNGYYGDSEVAVLVLAETEVAAIEQARIVFQDADYCPEYSQKLEVETVFFDTSKPQCTSVIECSEVHWMENEG